MKIALSPTNRNGLATVIVLAVLAIMLVYIMANIRALNALDQEVKLVEQKQIHRLTKTKATAIPSNTSPAETNPVHE